MDTSPYYQFCAEFCKEAGARVPDVSDVGDGANGFEMELDGTPVSVLHVAVPEGVDEVRILIEFGAPAKPDDVTFWQGLLDANFTFMGSFSLCFSRDPGNGDIILQMKAPLATTSGAALLHECRRLAALAADWRRGEFRIGVPQFSASAPLTTAMR